MDLPSDEFSVHQPLREAPGGLSGHGSREQKSPLSNGSFHALAPSLLEDLSVRKLSVGAALAAKPDNSQEFGGVSSSVTGSGRGGGPTSCIRIVGPPSPPLSTVEP